MDERTPDGEAAPESDDAEAPARRGPVRRIVRLLGLAGGVVITAILVVALAIEVLMAVNARIVDETDFSLRNDWDSDPEAVLELPGAGSIPDLPAPPESDTAAFRAWLVQRHAPVLVQLIGYRPGWDLPVAVDFDGNDDPRDNPASSERTFPRTAALYGELTAITADSWYLTYSVYHLRDYDHPVREIIVRTSHHDGDNEGFHLRVDRETREVVAAETWFHNRFVLCATGAESTGTDPVLGKLHFEGTHPIVYQQDMGHGIRCAQAGDTVDLDRVKIFRPALGRETTRLRPDRRPEYDHTYELRDFAPWYRAAALDASADSSIMFVGRIRLNEGMDGPPLEAVQYIAGNDREDISHWSRPKPMWSWDDIWDDIPIATWHFLPSYSFATRGGVELSHDYEYNRPAELLFGMTGNELAEAVSWDPGSAAGRIRNTDTQRTKWTNFDPGLRDIGRRQYWWAAEELVATASTTVQRLFNRYVMRVFANLG